MPSADEMGVAQSLLFGAAKGMLLRPIFYPQEGFCTFIYSFKDALPSFNLYRALFVFSIFFVLVSFLFSCRCPIVTHPKFLTYTLFTPVR